VSPALRLYLDFVVFAFGAVVGSFLNVCIHRMPRDQSIIRPPSHCPHCGARIGWRDNIPLASYLALRGKCRQCGAAIGSRYFLVELLTATLFLLAWVKFPFGLCAFYWLIIAALIAATFIDLEHFIIPNEITYGGIVLGLLLSPVSPVLRAGNSALGAALQSAVGMLTGGLSLLAVAVLGEKVFKKEAMGMGDVKLLAALGALLGWQAALFTLFVSSVAGGVVGLALIAARRGQWGTKIPFGPYIAFGAAVWIFSGREIVEWYFGFLKG
jgi:leader peptidase (prepilin peptidase)/N-methyltransferase